MDLICVEGSFIGKLIEEGFKAYMHPLSESSDPFKMIRRSPPADELSIVLTKEFVSKDQNTL